MNTEPVIPPSSVFVFWPGDEPPLEEEIRLRLGEWGHAADVGSVEDTHWCFRLELVDRPVSALVWAEDIAAGTRDRLGLADWTKTTERRQAEACRWMVGIECPLSLRGPSADYQWQLRLADAISRDWAPAFFDANAGAFWTSSDLRQLISSSVPPRTSTLYSVHRKLQTNSDSNAEPTYWVHTHGLERAGVPDLELFDVPHTLLPAASELIESIADLWIEFQTPDPEIAVTIGPDLKVAWRPWHAVVAEQPADAVGGWVDRKDGYTHAGYRAVIVEAGLENALTVGPTATGWQPPLQVLRRLVCSDAVIYKTLSHTQRLARLARERWGTFGLLFAEQKRRAAADWRFTVKLEYRAAGEANSAGSEHLWFEVDRLRPNGIFGRLLSTPPAGNWLTELSSPTWHDLDRLSDWRIITSQKVYDPDSAGVLLEPEDN